MYQTSLRRQLCQTQKPSRALVCKVKKMLFIRNCESQYSITNQTSGQEVPRLYLECKDVVLSDSR